MQYKDVVIKKRRLRAVSVSYRCLHQSVSKNFVDIYALVY